MKNFFQELFLEIKNSFFKSLKGEEELKNVIWFWGTIAYVTSFIINKIIIISKLNFIDITLSWLVLIYFVWHIYVTKKCAPKKPKLTEEEKELLKKESAKNRAKKIFNKIISREPITKWNPAAVTIVIDLLFIAHFAGYLLR